jgi:CBS domain-containing protein
MQNVEPTMETVMRPPAHTVTPATPVDDARQLFIAETLRSLIVVDEDRPVGIVSWAEIGALNEPVPGKTVADVMAPNPPAVERDAPISAGRQALAGTDHDVIPVVDQRGALVGEALRRELLSPDEPFAAEPRTATETVGAHLQVQPTMEVMSAAGDSVGTVENVTKDVQGRVTHIDVKSGRLMKHHKRIPVDLVNRVEGHTVFLAIDKDELKRLPDV